MTWSSVIDMCLGLLAAQRAMLIAGDARRNPSGGYKLVIEYQGVTQARGRLQSGYRSIRVEVHRSAAPGVWVFRSSQTKSGNGICP